MRISSQEELDILREGGKRLRAIIETVGKAAQPGVAVKTLDTLAWQFIRAAGDTPAFLGYSPEGARRPFPATLCVSVNDEAVHGIPTESEKVLRDGDIVSLDTGLIHKGLITDICITVPVGVVDAQGLRLIEVAKKARDAGVAAVKAGARLGDIGHAVEMAVRGSGFTIIEELGGHGVGKKVHEQPHIFHTGKPGTGSQLLSGQVITIEPTISEGRGDIRLAKDGYTFKTVDGSRTAQFEHTIIVTEEGAEILTLL